MSFAELLEQLPSLTPEERELIVQRVFELDDEPLTPEQEALIEKRLAEHDADPTSAIPAEEMFDRLQKRCCK